MYDLAHKFSFCLSDDNTQAQEAFVLLYELEHYINGAILQTTRINKTRLSINRKMQKLVDKVYEATYKNPKKDFDLTILHCDYHFYFVCIGQCDKLLNRLGEVLNDPDLKILYTKFKEQFDKDIRDHLEHIDERAIGKKFGRDIGHISDFGNFPGDSFSFNGKEYPVNKQKLDELKKIYEETLEILYNNHASKDEHFVMMELNKRRTKAILKQVKKQYKLT